MRLCYSKLFVMIVLLLQACSNLLSDNRNNIIIESPNTSRTYKLNLFVKEGGATVGNSYQISVLAVSEELENSDIGNAFIADDHDGAISEDTSRVKFRWINNDSVEVIYDTKLRVFKKEPRVGIQHVFAKTWAFEKVLNPLSLMSNRVKAEQMFFKYPCFSKPLLVVHNQQTL